MRKSKYFDPKVYLPYQRNFIFITSERNVGKTYSTQKFVIERFLEKGEKNVYYVRTQEERKNSVYGNAFKKVMMEQFPNYEFIFKGTEMYWKENEDTERLMGTCVALSEANKTKRINLPRSRWGIFDEYILDDKRKSAYVNGFNEPELFVKEYHTIDREEDYHTVFLLGNNIEFFNPYHIYPAFNIQYVPRGQLWKSENVIYQQIEASEELKEQKKNSKFLRMIQGTEYGNYAVEGKYINDNEQYLLDRSRKAKLKFNFDSLDETYGVWHDMETGLTFIDAKYDPNFPIWFTFYEERMTGQKRMSKGKTDFLIKWLGNQFKRGLLRWPSMEIKVKSMEAIKKML